MRMGMTGLPFASIGILLMVACLIAMLSRRLGLSYVVGLVIAGILIALLPNSPGMPLSRDLIFNILLPPLVFEAALQLEWQRFRTELPLTLTLAFVGVAIAAAVVAAGMHLLIGWSWIGAGLFGVLIAATDPVSVIASFREMGCAPRVSMVVESESLLNDGVAAVGFAVLSGNCFRRSSKRGECPPGIRLDAWRRNSDRSLCERCDPSHCRTHRRPSCRNHADHHRCVWLVPACGTLGRVGDHQRNVGRAVDRQRGY